MHVTHIAAFAAVACIALLTYKAGRKIGLVAFGVVTLMAVSASLLLGRWDMLSDAALGAFLGLPLLIATVVALDHKAKRESRPPEQGTGHLATSGKMPDQ